MWYGTHRGYRIGDSVQVFVISFSRWDLIVSRSVIAIFVMPMGMTREPGRSLFTYGCIFFHIFSCHNTHKCVGYTYQSQWGRAG